MTLPPSVGPGASREMDILTSELFTRHQVLLHVHSHHIREGLSSTLIPFLRSFYSHQPSLCIALAHTLQRLLCFTNQGWAITLQWVPSCTGIHDNEFVEATAKIALMDQNIMPFSQPIHS